MFDVLTQAYQLTTAPAWECVSVICQRQQLSEAWQSGLLRHTVKLSKERFEVPAYAVVTLRMGWQSACLPWSMVSEQTFWMHQKMIPSKAQDGSGSRRQSLRDAPSRLPSACELIWESHESNIIPDLFIRPSGIVAACRTA